MLINKISALELNRKNLKSALLVGIGAFPATSANRFFSPSFSLPLSKLILRRNLRPAGTRGKQNLYFSFGKLKEEDVVGEGEKKYPDQHKIEHIGDALCTLCLVGMS